ncbi:DUF2177 family protein [uncultured Litoreibacter sp.]|uniref:DUF2177 family protein n=1 Tax=uncultured Litoreibacter sp. TaxID=1392394 RepID=UPI002629F4C0|nr:DUF2177 family protein [uncultured Litoreibacter sp.]
MTYLFLYLVTFILFFGIDFLGLGVVVKPIFEKHVPDLLLDSPRIGPALAFYAFYVAGLVWFVSAPALVGDKSLWWVAGNAAIIAGIGFGTYEFTSLAVTKGWSWEIVAVDLSWGIAMTTTSAVAGVAVIRWFS